MYTKRYSQDWVFDVAEAFTALARDKGIHPVSLAVAWAAAHPAVTCPIIGARNVDQLQPSLQAADVDMTAELYAEVAALSPTPPPATDRFEEG
jgi:aryl-alcohol dehydrogenase-like predicted oxidoreductase